MCGLFTTRAHPMCFVNSLVLVSRFLWRHSLPGTTFQYSISYCFTAYFSRFSSIVVQDRLRLSPAKSTTNLAHPSGPVRKRYAWPVQLIVAEERH